MGIGSLAFHSNSLYLWSICHAVTLVPASNIVNGRKSKRRAGANLHVCRYLCLRVAAGEVSMKPRWSECIFIYVCLYYK